MMCLSYKGRNSSFFFKLLLVFSIARSVDSFRVGANNVLTCRDWRHCREWESAYTHRKGGTPHSHFQTKLSVKIREWREDDVKEIQSLLSDSVQSAFDPEGPLEVDCGSAAAIQESYNGDGGCFLVATNDTNDSEILGTAALIVGTQIAYLKSGASISTAAIIGAVRRVCTVKDADALSSDSIIHKLLNEVETRAAQAGAAQLIMLAYPSTRRPTPELLQSLGYLEFPAKLPGVDAIQYGKVLSDDTNTEAADVDTSTSNNAVGDAAVGTLFVTVLLIAFGFVANLMGFEILSSADNRGVGSPLSIQEVQRLEQDEQLKRTDLDGDQQTRQWEDLGMEERREEAALMRIIQGQDVRAK